MPVKARLSQEMLSREATGHSAQYVPQRLWLVLMPVAGAVLPAGPQQLLLAILAIRLVLQPAQWLPWACCERQRYLLHTFQGFRDPHAEEVTARDV